MKIRELLIEELNKAKANYVEIIKECKTLDRVREIITLITHKDMHHGLCHYIALNMPYLNWSDDDDFMALFKDSMSRVIEGTPHSEYYYFESYYKTLPPSRLKSKKDIIESLEDRVELIDLMLTENETR